MTDALDKTRCVLSIKYFWIELFITQMPKVKGAIIKLVSMAGTGFFYTTYKNPKNTTKLLLRKYDPFIRQYALFKVSKIYV
jgi:large subunit ribosomal protein L33